MHGQCGLFPNPPSPPTHALITVLQRLLPCRKSWLNIFKVTFLNSFLPPSILVSPLPPRATSQRHTHSRQRSEGVSIMLTLGTGTTKCNRGREIAHGVLVLPALLCRRNSPYSPSTQSSTDVTLRRKTGRVEISPHFFLGLSLTFSPAHSMEVKEHIFCC